VVTARPALQSLPQAPLHLPGFFDLYGQPVPVLDLCRRLGVQQDRSLVERKVVVMNLAGGALLGVEASEVWDPEGLSRPDVLDETSFTAPFEGLKGRLDCLARSGTRGLVPVLRTQALLDEDELAVLATSLARARAEAEG